MFEELKGGDGIPYISVGTLIEAGGSSQLAQETPQLSLQPL